MITLNAQDREQSQLITLHLLTKLLVGITVSGRWFMEGEFFHWSHFLWVGLAVPFFRYHYTMLNSLHYSYWFLQLLVGIVLFSQTLLGLEGVLIWSFLLALMSFAVEVYCASSPLFFPRVRWYEYDFRFRSDVKVKVEADNFCSDAMLTDLRREAACVCLFEPLPLGAQIEIRWGEGSGQYKGNFPAKVYGMREMAPGRGIIHGVKVLAESADEKRAHRRLKKLWLLRKKNRLQIPKGS